MPCLSRRWSQSSSSECLFSFFRSQTLWRNRRCRPPLAFVLAVVILVMGYVLASSISSAKVVCVIVVWASVKVLRWPTTRAKRKNWVEGRFIILNYMYRYHGIYERRGADGEQGRCKDVKVPTNLKITASSRIEAMPTKVFR